MSSVILPPELDWVILALLVVSASCNVVIVTAPVVRLLPSGWLRDAVGYLYGLSVGVLVGTLVYLLFARLPTVLSFGLDAENEMGIPLRDALLWMVLGWTWTFVLSRPSRPAHAA